MTPRMKAGGIPCLRAEAITTSFNVSGGGARVVTRVAGILGAAGVLMTLIRNSASAAVRKPIKLDRASAGITSLIVWEIFSLSEWGRNSPQRPPGKVFQVLELLLR